MKRNVNAELVDVKPYVSKRSKESLKTSESKDEKEIYLPVTHFSNSVRIKNLVPEKYFTTKKIYEKPITSLKWNYKSVNIVLSSALDKFIVLLDKSDCHLLEKARFAIHDEGIKDAIWTHGMESIITASFDKTAKLIDAESGSVLKTYTHKDVVTKVMMHPTQSNVFLTGTSKSGVFAWDARQKESIKHFKATFGQIQDMTFISDNTTLITSSEVLKRNTFDKAIMAWDFASSALMPVQIYQEPFSCSYLKQHPSGEHFLAQSAANYIVIFDTQFPYRMNKCKRYGEHKCSGYRVGFDISRDGRIIYSGDTDGFLFCYDNYTSKLLKKIKCFNSPCVEVASHPVLPSTLLVGAWDGSISILQ
ncbi:WD repeat-containing protein 25 isoform X1 [Hydra vulgaris]|uniref:WD repeat-containing protein 25 isoform X1 n=1 Tax=Hydra vulgaris TaxID=6087 RepID=A0ABM4CJY0_HYDVU